MIIYLHLRSRPVDSEDEKISHSSASLERPLFPHMSIKVIQVSCGDAHTLALAADGEVWSWGAGCQTGHGTQNECIRTPRLVEGLMGRNVISIVCGAYHSMALIKDPSTIPKIVPQKTSKASKGSKKKPSRKMRRFSRSKESTKGKKAPSLLQSNEVLPNTETRRSSKTYLSYESEVLSQTNLGEVKEQSKTNQIELLKMIDSHHRTDDEKNDNSSQEEVHSVHKSDEHYDDSQISSTNTTVPSNVSKLGSDLTTQIDPSLSKSNFQIEANITEIKPSSQTANEDTPGTGSIPIHRLSINDNNYVIPAHPKRTQLESAISSSPEYSCSPPQSGFSHTHFDNPSQDIFVTTDVSGSLCKTSSLFESVEPTSLTSLGSISDSDEVTSPTTEEQPSSVSSYLGIGNLLTSRLRQEMDITKLTTAVYDSVTGIFMSPSTLPVQADKSAVHGAHCSECGVLGFCVCNGKISTQETFIHEGYDTQVWTWGSGSCGQLGHGDTEDR